MKKLKKFKDELTRNDSKRKTKALKPKKKLVHQKRAHKTIRQYLNEEE